MPKADWDDDEWDDAEDDLDDDLDDDDTTITCPYCKRPVYEDAERCPHCERYISSEDAPHGPKPLWIILGAVLCLLMTLAWIFR
jgi:hypothetical protein